MSYLTYLDLVGTGYYARFDRRTYEGSLNSLSDTLHANDELLDKSGRVFLLHSSAFIFSSDLKKLVKFLRAVRVALLSKRIFVQAVVAEGKLSEEYSIQKGKLRGFNLGIGTAAAFGEHYRFSGIGIKLLDPVAQKLEQASSEDIVSTSFIQARARAPEVFFDLRYEDGQLSNERLDLICHEYVRLRSRFRTVGGHFVPFFITLIRSTDWSMLATSSSNLDEAGVARHAATKAFFDRLSGAWYAKHFAEVPWRELVAYTLLDAINSTGKTPKEFKMLARRMSAQKFLRRLEDVPESILSHNSREALLREL